MRYGLWSNGFSPSQLLCNTELQIQGHETECKGQATSSSISISKKGDQEHHITVYLYVCPTKLNGNTKCKKKNKYLNSKHMMPCSHQLWMHGCLTRETLVQQLARSTPVTSPLLQSVNHMKSLNTSQT